MDARTSVRKIFEESIEAKKKFLADEVNVTVIAEAAARMIDCCRRGGKIIVLGNGGSAADSQHMAAELVVRFEKERVSIPCIALSANTSILTATGNDYSYDKIFSRQIEALADPNDVIFAISTSGNSRNILEAVKTAHAKKIHVIALTGHDGGKLVGSSDMAIVVRNLVTARIQEIHITIIHVLCKLIEDAFVS